MVCRVRDFWEQIELVSTTDKMSEHWQEKISRLTRQAIELSQLLNGEISHPGALAGIGSLRLRLKAFVLESADIPKRLKTILEHIPTKPSCGVVILDKKGKITHFDQKCRELFGIEPVNRLLKNGQAKIKFFHGDMETPYKEDELPWYKLSKNKSDEHIIPRIWMVCSAHPKGRWISCTASRLSNDSANQSKAISFLDQHELVHREKELAALAKSMDRILADMDNVASEFKLLCHRMQNTQHSLIDEIELFVPRTTERPPVAEEENSNGKKSKTALIVDDIPVSQKLMEMRLKKLSFICEFAKDGKEAIEKAAKVNYDLIFMDCDMPVMNGFEASKLIRQSELESGRHVPIIAMTAYDRPDDRERCLSAGMDEYLSKGASARLLEEIVDWCMHRGAKKHTPPEQGELEEEELDIAMLKETYSLYELSDILNSFVQGTNTVMRCLRMAIDEKEVRSIAHFAYSLKGPFATLGLVMTARLTATLTDSSEANDWIDVDEYYDSLAEKCKRFLHQVDEFNSKLEKSK